MDGLTMHDRVGRLRVQRPAALALGDPALRLRVERRIDALDLRPAQLPAGAVLIVRRLSMRMELGAGNAPAARQVLDELLARAVRPALASVPESAPAVLFADAAELLACLTRDVLRGRVPVRWYWQQFAGWALGDGAPALGAIWQQHAHAAPAALLLLTAPERRALAAALGDDGCTVLARAMAAAFAVELPALAAYPGAAQPALSAQVGAPVDARAGDTIVRRAVAPWQPWVGAAELDGLAPARALLLGLGLALAHAPAYARSAAFQQAAARWLDAATAPVSRASVVASRADDGAPVLPVVAAAPPAGEIAPLHRTDPGAPAAIESTPAAPAGDPPQQRSPHAPGAAPSDSASPAPAEAPSLAASETMDGIETRLAGVLYLVNVMRWLDLPAAAHTSGIDERLGAWAMLEALARLLLSPRVAPLADDPLWRCLAELDGRSPGSVIGADLSRLDAFRLPAQWVQRRLPIDRPWVAASQRGRLRIADPTRGVLVADVPLAGHSPEVAAAAEIERYRAAGVDARVVPAVSVRLPYLPVAVRAAVAPGPAWWLRRAHGFIRYALAWQVRCAPDDLAALLAGLCRRRGRVTISRTHVDLYLPMEQIDMAARRSGLDQDPGWAPDFGRIITFHFA